MTLDKSQQDALNGALNNNISYIIGYAGSGKSFTARAIETELKNKGWHVSKVAPTGKAALRIQGTTIHSWLEPEVQEDKYKNPVIVGYHKDCISNKECLIVDEASMIDDDLWKEIIERYDNQSSNDKKLIFIGDPGQLEPVGEGTPFINAISKKNNVFTLNTIHRQKEGNDILDFATMIRQQKPLSVEGMTDVRIISIDEALAMGAEDIENTQIICPKNKEEFGTKTMNTKLQDLIKDKLGDVVLSTIKWNHITRKYVKNQDIRLGDKVVVTQNNFARDVTNGTVGIVDSVKWVREYNEFFRMWEDIEMLIIDTPLGKKQVPLSWASKRLDLAYALTVHKMQGSDADNIIIIATQDQKSMINTKLLYTAVTRAKSKCFVVM